jgi:hypothetical protein
MTWLANHEDNKTHCIIHTIRKRIDKKQRDMIHIHCLKQMKSSQLCFFCVESKKSTILLKFGQILSLYVARTFIFDDCDKTAYFFSS